MNKLLEVLQAGRVRRWHTNPQLSWTDDYTDGHAARVTMLALTLKPDLSRDAIIHALGHDLGERHVADIASDAKRRLPEEMLRHLRKAEEDAVRELVPGYVSKLGLQENEAEIIVICDWLDAYFWAISHNPKVLRQDAWLQQRTDAVDWAKDIGLGEEVSDFLTALEWEYI